MRRGWSGAAPGWARALAGGLLVTLHLFSSIGHGAGRPSDTHTLSHGAPSGTLHPFIACCEPQPRQDNPNCSLYHMLSVHL